MAKITVELDGTDAERVIENYEEVIDLLKLILEELKEHGKILRDD
jgi:phosphate uptake regulator